MSHLPFGHHDQPQQNRPGTLLTTLTGHTGKVNTVAWSPDGRLLASGSMDSTLRIWNPPNPQPIAVIRVDEPSAAGFKDDDDDDDDEGAAVWTAAWSPDGRLVAFAASENTHLWDATTGTRLKPLAHPDGGDTLCAAWSPDGNFIVTGDDDSTVWLWDVNAGTKLAHLKGHKGDFIWSVAWSPDGRLIASASDDKTVRLWDANSHQTVAVLPLQSYTPQSVAWSRDGRFLAMGGAHQPLIWDISTGQPFIHTWGGHHSDHLTTGVSWSPDGRMLAAGSRDQRQPLSLWDVAGRKHHLPLQGHTQHVGAVAWSPDIRLLASASEDQTVRIWLVG